MFSFQGFSYDHVELNFFLNGSNLNSPVLGIKGTVYPVFYGQFKFVIFFETKLTRSWGADVARG
jgi:hypothetical protein